MKTETYRRTKMNSVPAIPYPNAATRQELFHKYLDLVLVCAMGAGAAACLLLFLAIA